MEVSKLDRLALYTRLKKQLHQFTNAQIENGIMLYCLTDYECNTTNYFDEDAKNVAAIIENNGLPTDLETIIEFFESLLDENYRGENGIVFTPQYISDFFGFSSRISLCPF